MIKWILIFWKLFIFTTLSSQTPYLLDTLYPVHDLDPYLKVVADPDLKLNIKNIRSDTSLDFQLIGDLGVSYPAMFTLPQDQKLSRCYWGKVTLKSNGETKKWQLHLEDRLLGIGAWSKGNGKVDVYAYSHEQLLFHKKTGTSYLSHEKEINNPWNLNSVYLDLPVNQTIDLYLRIEANNAGLNPFFNASIRSPDFQHYHPYYSATEFSYVFKIGITFIVFIYFLLQFFYTKNWSYLWFSLWVISVIFPYLFSTEPTAGFFLANIPNLRYPLWMMCSNSILFTFWLFGMVLLETRKKLPVVHAIILSIVIFSTIETGLIGFLAYNHMEAINGGITIHLYFQLLISIINLVTGVYLYLKSDLIGKLFGLAVILGSSFYILGTIWSLRWIDLTFTPYIIGLLFMFILFLFAIAYKHGEEKKLRLQEKEEAITTEAAILRLKDLDEVKSRFFSNISHEFRTPLSLILGPLSNVENSNVESDSVLMDSKHFQIMQRNANRMNELVEQLLELSKIESGHVKLYLTQGSIIKYLKALIHSFESMAERKNINLITSYPQEILHAYFDKDKMEKILSNLISNALKFTASNGTVNISVSDVKGSLWLEVKDNGKGIPKDQLGKIFERFYRVEGNEEKGTGIGLALTKELVEIYNGKINVSSTEGEGTTFKVKIPYTLPLLPEAIQLKKINNLPIAFEDLSHQDGIDGRIKRAQNENQPIVLLVEDNKDVQSYLFSNLKGRYHLLQAYDGNQGERIAIEHIPDLIITDLMMPKKDGYELIHSLKSNKKTSHIPIIMLTAKSDFESKLQGLNIGADAYMNKPFRDEELFKRVENLLISRKNIWDNYRNNGSKVSNNENSSLRNMDILFLDEVYKTIEENLDKEAFTVENLASNVGFSRSQLHRKLKAITDKSANQLIVEFRLNKAKELLISEQGTVSEIAYEVGYNSLPHFTKSFKKLFGVLPSRIHQSSLNQL